MKLRFYGKIRWPFQMMIFILGEGQLVYTSPQLILPCFSVIICITHLIIIYKHCGHMYDIVGWG